jgi:hypothetical protein
MDPGATRKSAESFAARHADGPAPRTHGTLPDQLDPKCPQLVAAGSMGRKAAPLSSEACIAQRLPLIIAALPEALMTTTRIFLAGVLGAVAMFIWTAIAHMALPLGEAGVQNTTNDEALLSELKSTVKNGDGFYIYPSMGLPPDATHAQQSAAMEKYAEKLEKNPIRLFHLSSGRFASDEHGQIPDGRIRDRAWLRRFWRFGCSPKRASSRSAAGLGSFSPSGLWPRYRPTFRIGTGGASRRYTRHPTCLFRSSDFSWLVWLPRLCSAG